MRKLRAAVHDPFHTIAADPPWLYSSSDPLAACPYPCLDTATICALGPQLRSIVANDADLYLWTTKDHVEDAFVVARCWGFVYRSMLVWDKQHMGLGARFRVQTEFCLFCQRGNGACRDDAPRGIRNLISEPRTRHSVKPSTFFSLVESASIGPYLELFARASRSGWSSWGNELHGDIPLWLPPGRLSNQQSAIKQCADDRQSPVRR